MSNLTRRRFLGWTSAGAAGVGLLAFVPRPVSRPNPASLAAAPAAGERGGGFSDPLVAYVHNAASGNVSLMVGTREVTFHDPELVSHLFGRAG